MTPGAAPPISHVRATESCASRPSQLREASEEQQTRTQEPPDGVLAMWGSVLGLALLVALNPVLLGLILYAQAPLRR